MGWKPPNHFSVFILIGILHLLQSCGPGLYQLSETGSYRPNKFEKKGELQVSIRPALDFDSKYKLRGETHISYANSSKWFTEISAGSNKSSNLLSNSVSINKFLSLGGGYYFNGKKGYYFQHGIFLLYNDEISYFHTYSATTYTGSFKDHSFQRNFGIVSSLLFPTKPIMDKMRIGFTARLTFSNSTHYHFPYYNYNQYKINSVSEDRRNVFRGGLYMNIIIPFKVADLTFTNGLIFISQHRITQTTIIFHPTFTFLFRLGKK